MVICSDCYDNANIYSRTREYCPYAYLGDDDPPDKTLHLQQEDATLESFIKNHDASVFVTSHDKRLSGHTPPEQYANGETWAPVQELSGACERFLLSNDITPQLEACVHVHVMRKGMGCTLCMKVSFVKVSVPTVTLANFTYLL